MPGPESSGAPTGATTSTLVHRVGFFETDAMGIVHHTNYVRWFENARVVWLDEHDQPYTRYADSGLHFAVTRVEADYQRSARFDDRVEVCVWLEWARGASLRMAYAATRAGELLATGATEHAAVDLEGRVRRIPRERRVHLQSRALQRV